MSDETRLTINENPLAVVTARAGEPAAAPTLVLAIKRSATARIQRVTVHQNGCSKIPAAGPAAQGASWAVTPASQDQVSRMLETADVGRIPTSVSCRICGGWTTVA